MKTLQERLVYARERAKKSQSEVAEFIGITQPSFSELETGKSLRSKYTAEIAHYLGVSAYWLATGQGELGGVVASDITLRIDSLRKADREAVVYLINRLNGKG